ncbi:MAG: S8 family serine peptidase [Candidatus Competibacterales bacterium]
MIRSTALAFYGLLMGVLLAPSTLAQPAAEVPVAWGEVSLADLPLFGAPVGADVIRDFAGSDGVGRDGPMAKLGLPLITLHHRYTTEPVGGMVALEAARQQHLLVQRPDFDASVSLSAISATTGEALRAEWEAAGLGISGMTMRGRVVSGMVKIRDLPILAGLDNLLSVIPSYATTHVGAVDSQGDAAMNADLARLVFNVSGLDPFGVSGEGIQVGILSDSFNALEGLSTDIASGDLPASVTILQDFIDPSAIDEGRGMAQLIFDVAPNAGISFFSAFAGDIVTFANGIRALAANGADVIVDDVIFFAEPMYQDGFVAEAADEVVAQGIPYFSSAGNSGRLSMEDGPYRASSLDLAFLVGFTAIAHDFDPGPDENNELGIIIPVDSGGTFILQWDEPSTFAGDGTNGADTGLEMFLFDTGFNLVALSAFINVDAPPVEIFQFFNDGSFDGDGDGSPDEVFFLIITRFTGPGPENLKLVVSGSGDINLGAELPNLANKSTLYGHANAAGAAAVGAAAYYFTPGFPLFEDTSNPLFLNDFSSAGPTPILLDTAGNRLGTPDVRPKPQFTAPDGGDTTFFPPVSLVPLEDSDIDFTGFPNFFGTSAAAPHAAAVAALMLEADPSLTPAEIYELLADSAIDIVQQADPRDDINGDPIIIDDPLPVLRTNPLPVGFDDDSGEGLIQADQAIATAVCDTDGNLKIDIDDIIAIVASRGAAAADEVGDANNNGAIAVDDARVCVNFCDNPGCAASTPD